jgi:hypothetical protein
MTNSLALADALAAQRQDRGAARPFIHHPRGRRHTSQAPGEVTATLAFTPAGLKWSLPPVGEAISDHVRSFAATVFDRKQEIGSTQLEVGKTRGSYAALRPPPADPLGACRALGALFWRDTTQLLADQRIDLPESLLF